MQIKTNIRLVEIVLSVEESSIIVAALDFIIPKTNKFLNTGDVKILRMRNAIASTTLLIQNNEDI